MTDEAQQPPAAGIRARLDAIRQSPAAHGALLGLFSLATALILALSDELTRGPIADRASEDLNASLAQVLPPALYHNDPTTALRQVSDAEEGEVQVFVSTSDGSVTALAYELTGYGYSGAIRVLMGLAPDGTLLGVRVLAHTETPGLGDKVEAAKSDWIDGFAGRSLDNPAPEGWKVKRDGGDFDQFSGATITPRAVVGTVHRGLALFARQRSVLLVPPAPPAAEKESR